MIENPPSPGGFLAYLPKLNYGGPVAKETIQRRIRRLRAEIIELSRLNEEYLRISHTMQVEQSHRERRTRLEQIVAELKALADKSSQNY
jgi:hypothetical protein